jgi:RHS repeat-associated protein
MKTVNSGSVATYVYDAAGRRVRKTASGTTTEYVYDLGGAVVAEFVGATWTKGYVYLGGLLAQYSSGTTYFAVKDHLGSTRVLSTVAGGPHESYDFAPYGEPVGAQGTTTAKKFTGKERDAESGLDYYGARYYASLAGCFQSPDLPFIDQHPTNPQSWNLYAYARNNPLKFIDPSGNFATMVNGQATTVTLDCLELRGDMMGLVQSQTAKERLARAVINVALFRSLSLTDVGNRFVDAAMRQLREDMEKIGIQVVVVTDQTLEDVGPDSRQLANSLQSGSINIVVGTALDFGNGATGAGIWTKGKEKYVGIRVNTVKHDPKRDTDVLTHEMLHILNRHIWSRRWIWGFDWLRQEWENYVVNSQIATIRRGKGRTLRHLLDLALEGLPQ